MDISELAVRAQVELDPREDAWRPVNEHLGLLSTAQPADQKWALPLFTVPYELPFIAVTKRVSREVFEAYAPYASDPDRWSKVLADVKALVEEHGSLPVPMKLRNAVTKDGGPGPDYISGDSSTGGNSLDNTLRVGRLVPTEWVLLDIRIHAVANGFAHGHLDMWAEDGTLPYGSAEFGPPTTAPMTSTMIGSMEAVRDSA